MIIFDPEYVAAKSVRPLIKVLGIGGAGGNAVTMLAKEKLCGVECIALNTDAQALAALSLAQKIQLGSKNIQGMGTGANPEIGRLAAEEDAQKIIEVVKDADIVFLIAGLGGGTGSGALPVVARILQEREILSIALTTKPFLFEGSKRMNAAEAALLKLEEYVDASIIIPNQKLFDGSENVNIPLIEAFEKVNRAISDCIKAVAETIHKPGHINVDFADIKATMTRMGKAIMGIGRSSGENRAHDAIHAALTSKLFEHTSLKGARSILLNIIGNTTLSLQEVGIIAEYIHEQAHHDAHIILGSAIDESLENEIMVTVIATGFEEYLKTRQTPKQSAFPYNHHNHQQTSQNYMQQAYQQFQPHIQEQQKNEHNNYYQQAPKAQQNNLEVPALLRKLMAEQNSSQN